MLQLLSSLFGQVCDFLWEVVEGAGRGVAARRDMGQGNVTEPPPVPQPLQGWRVPWPLCSSTSTLWFLTSSSPAGKAAGCAKHCAHLCCKGPCHSSSCFPSSFPLFISQLGSIKGSALKLQRVYLRNKSYVRNQLILHIAGDNCFLGASYVELYW